MIYYIVFAVLLAGVLIGYRFIKQKPATEGPAQTEQIDTMPKTTTPEDGVQQDQKQEVVQTQAEPEQQVTPEDNQGKTSATPGKDDNASDDEDDLENDEKKTTKQENQ